MSDPRHPHASGVPVVSAPEPKDAVAHAAAAPLSLACRSDAFCEDFESADPTSRWTAVGGDGLSFVAPSASHGVRSMRVAAHGGAPPAYLRLENGTQGASFSGALAFALRLDGAPAARIGGPVVAIGDARVGVELWPHGVMLAQKR